MSQFNVSANPETGEVEVTNNGFTITISMDAGTRLVDVPSEKVTLEELLEAAGGEYDYDLQYKTGNRILRRNDLIDSGSVVFVLKEDGNGN